MTEPSFYEFFCGGGMARAGLGRGWKCLFANDIDEKKARAYRENWGGDALCVGDVHRLTAAEVPGRADLAWASFPCQDLSLAGPGQGLAGARSGAFWGFHALMAQLGREGRAPTIILLENVVGALASNRGEDFVAICRALQRLGYRFGALTIDAVHFLPQSRPRLFVLAVRRDAPIEAALTGSEPHELFASPSLMRAQALLPRALAADWLWWSPPTPPRRNVELVDLLERSPSDAPWRSAEETERMVSILSKGARAKLETVRKRTGVQVGALYRRMRPDGEGGRRMRAEARFDGLAGCLRTPAGGSSRQFLLICQDSDLRSRLLSAREAARLMGLPEEYELPSRYNEAYHLVGDGVAVPVVRFLAQTLLEPLVGQGSVRALAAAE
ncbi:MAG TPA: DNA cytosine methyltransferase [Roseiarcus sp.]|nr:DNA cytosine methyltransferase [Roseiarcus sp.]